MTRLTPIRGLTLVETLIVIALFVAALGAVVLMYLGLLSWYGYGQATIENETAARGIMHEMEDMVLPASLVLTSRTFSTGTYTSATTSLVTLLPSIDATGVVVNGKYDYAAFYLSNGKAYRRIEADAVSSRKTGTRQLSDTETTLLFTYDASVFADVKKVTLAVTVSVPVKGTTVADTLVSTFALRNHAD